jgi:hypothetical protein
VRKEKRATKVILVNVARRETLVNEESEARKVIEEKSDLRVSVEKLVHKDR